MRGRVGERWLLEDRSGASLIVTRWGHATPAERAAALDPHAARSIVQQTWRGPWRDEGRGDLVGIHGLLNPDDFNIHNVTTQELARRVFDAVERGRLLVLRGHRKASANGQTDAVGVLVGQVMGGRREVSFEGQGYRIVDLSSGVLDTGIREWRQIDHAEAVAIVDRMLDRIPRTPAERTDWGALLKFMKGDGREPRVALLRRDRRAGVAPQPEPAAPPRAPARPPQPEEELSWIEVRVSDTTGAPYSGRVRVKLPNGASIDASTDESGVLRLDGILPGSCTVALLDVSERLRAA